MALAKALNPGSKDIVGLCQPERERSPSAEVESSFPVDVLPSGSGRSRKGRWAIVIALGVVLAVAALAIIALAFMEGSWWYGYRSDCELDEEARARLEVIRERVDARGTMPEVVAKLDVALNPDAHPTDVRNYLIAAREDLRTVDDPEMDQIVRELGAIIQTVRGGPVQSETPMPTLEWPGPD